LNILIIEAYTDANIGSGALVENTVDILKTRHPDADIRVMAHYPKAFEELCNVDSVVDIFQYPFGKSRGTQVVWLLQTLFWMVVVFLQACVLPKEKIFFFKGKVRDFLWADAVVSVGAERINDKYIKNIIFSLYTYKIVKKLGCLMVLFPCTIGPFLFKWTRWLTTKALKSVDLVYTRDDQSFQTVCRLEGMDLSRVVNTSDVAVFQKQIVRNRALEIIGSGRGDNCGIVGISAMKWTYVANSINTQYSNYDAYVREMTKLADEIIERYGVRIVFYPTNYPVRGCREDDISTARDIYSGMKNKARAHIIETLSSPSELKGMLACSEVNITTRMHACILSTGASIPTISVNYLFKLKEYMHSLGLGDYSIDIEEFNANWALRAFDSLWQERPRWRTAISEAIRKKQKQLDASLERFDALLTR